MNRSNFLKKLGIGVVVVVVTPEVLKALPENIDISSSLNNSGMALWMQKDNGEFIKIADCENTEFDVELNADSGGWSDEIEKVKEWSMEFTPHNAIKTTIEQIHNI